MIIIYVIALDIFNNILLNVTYNDANDHWQTFALLEILLVITFPLPSTSWEDDCESRIVEDIHSLIF